MIRRRWNIYQRKSRQVVSVIYYFRKDALNDLWHLNDYCGKRKYAMQLTRIDMESGRIVSHYPDIELKQLQNQTKEVVKNE